MVHRQTTARNAAFASHHHPSHYAKVLAAGPSLPGKMHGLISSMYPKIYRSSAQAVTALNLVTLLSGYHNMVPVDMGQQLHSGLPRPDCVGGNLRHGGSRKTQLHKRETVQLTHNFIWVLLQREESGVPQASLKAQ